MFPFHRKQWKWCGKWTLITIVKHGENSGEVTVGVTSQDRNQTKHIYTYTLWLQMVYVQYVYFSMSVCTYLYAYCQTYKIVDDITDDGGMENPMATATGERILNIQPNRGIRPAANVDESNVPYQWCPARPFIVELMEAIYMDPFRWTTTWRLALQLSNIPVAIIKLDHRPYIFHSVAKRCQEQHLRLPSGGVSAEYTAAMYFDVNHGHEKRWLVRSHLASIMGFSV